MTKFFGWTEEEYQLNEEWIKEENASNQESNPEQPEGEEGSETPEAPNTNNQELGTARQEGGAEEEPQEPVAANDNNEKGEAGPDQENDFGIP
jgi:hypothetical protein